MKPAPNSRFSSVSSNLTPNDYSFDKDGLSTVLDVLRNSLYTDKLLAPIREYSTNAADANRLAGVSDPIEITLPTAINSTFSIRDFGPGLSQEEMNTIYISFGASTKRDSDAFNGTFGLGCKCAYAITNAFTVTSIKDGVKSVYSLFLDQHGLGKMALLGGGPTNERSGVLVEIPIPHDKRSEFINTAARFYYTFDWPYKIVSGYSKETFGAHYTDHVGTDKDTPLLAPRDIRFHHASLRYPHVGVVIVMGGVAYPVTSSNIPKNISSILNSNSVYFITTDIGNVQMAASREGLQYTKFTEQYLDRIMTGFVQKVRDGLLNQIKKLPLSSAYFVVNNYSNGALAALAPVEYQGLRLDLICSGKHLDIAVPEGVYIRNIDFKRSGNTSGLTMLLRAKGNVDHKLTLNRYTDSRRTMHATPTKFIVMDEDAPKFFRERLSDYVMNHLNKLSSSGTTNYGYVLLEPAGTVKQLVDSLPTGLDVVLFSKVVKDASQFSKKTTTTATVTKKHDDTKWYRAVSIPDGRLTSRGYAVSLNELTASKKHTIVFPIIKNAVCYDSFPSLNFLGFITRLTDCYPSSCFSSDFEVVAVANSVYEKEKSEYKSRGFITNETEFLNKLLTSLCKSSYAKYLVAGLAENNLTSLNYVSHYLSQARSVVLGSKTISADSKSLIEALLVKTRVLSGSTNESLSAVFRGIVSALPDQALKDNDSYNDITYRAAALSTELCDSVLDHTLNMLCGHLYLYSVVANLPGTTTKAFAESICNSTLSSFLDDNLVLKEFAALDI